MTKQFWPLCCLFFLCATACQSGEHDHSHDDHDHHHYQALQPLRYVWLERGAEQNQDPADYGDSLLLHFSLYQNGQRLAHSPNLGLVLPTKMHRNHLEEPLCQMSLGDSLHAFLSYDQALTEFAPLSSQLQLGSEIQLAYRLLKRHSRQERQAAQTQDYLVEKGFANLAEFEAEKQWVQNQALKQEQALIAFGQNQAKTCVQGQELRVQILDQGLAQERPNPSNKPHWYYILALPSGQIIDNTLSRGDRFQPDLSPQASLSRVWQHLLASKLGPKAQVQYWLPCDWAYGPQGQPPLIPPNTPLLLYIYWP